MSVCAATIYTFTAFPLSIVSLARPTLLCLASETTPNKAGASTWLPQPWPDIIYSDALAELFKEVVQHGA